MMDITASGVFVGLVISLLVWITTVFYGWWREAHFAGEDKPKLYAALLFWIAMFHLGVLLVVVIETLLRK